MQADSYNPAQQRGRKPGELVLNWTDSLQLWPLAWTHPWVTGVTKGQSSILTGIAVARAGVWAWQCGQLIEDTSLSLGVACPVLRGVWRLAE